MKRLIEQTLCEHGKWEGHGTWPKQPAGWCPGGSSREVTVDYEAAAKQLWHELGEVDGVWPTLWETHTDQIRRQANRIVGKALGGGP